MTCLCPLFYECFLQVSGAADEIAKLKSLLEEAAKKETESQAKISDMKEAKLTIQGILMSTFLFIGQGDA